jgi:hypothetical protein
MKSIKHFLAGIAAYMAWTGTVLSALYSSKTYDNALLLKASAAVTASADGTLIVDIGNGLAAMDLVVDVSAIDVVTTDESYEIIVQGSPDATFGTAANIASLGSITLGAALSARHVADGQGYDDVVGRYIMPVRNEKGGTTFRYLRIRTVNVGAVANSITYLAFLAKR